VSGKKEQKEEEEEGNPNARQRRIGIVAAASERIRKN